MKFNKQVALILIIFLLSLSTLIFLYTTQGPGWDLIAHYLHAKNIIQQKFISKNFIIWGGSVIQSGTFYIELFRPIASSALMIILMPVFRNPIFPYLILLYFLYLFAIWIFSKFSKIDNLLLYGILINPYFLYASFMLNSEEILSLVFVLIAIAFIIKRSKFSGIFLAIASMAQYTAPIFLPLIFLFKEPKKIASAFILFLITLIPWLLFNYIYFGNPLASYLISYQVAVGSRNLIPLSLRSLLIVLAFPIIYIALIFAVSKGKFKDSFINKIRKRTNITNIVSAFVGLSLIGYLIVVFRLPPSDQIRLGYFLSASLLIAIIVFVKDEPYAKRLSKYVALISITCLVAFIILYSVYIPISKTRSYNPNNSTSIINNAIFQLNKLGYSNCRVISNSWVFLIYRNVKAYAPYSSNYTTEQEYPIIAFKNPQPVPMNAIPNLNDSKVLYENQNFSILVPKNVTCVN